MTAPITAWLILVLCLGGMATIAIWSRGITRWRGRSVGGFIISMFLCAGALSMALGQPLPYWPGITVSEGEHTIIAYKLVENEAIYIWLDTGLDAPRYYSLPWSTKTAEALQKAQGEGEGDGEQGEGEFGVHTPGLEWSWDDSEPQFWATPQPQMPPKQAQEPAPHFEAPA
jgi:hypothetical protein